MATAIGWDRVRGLYGSYRHFARLARFMRAQEVWQTATGDYLEGQELLALADSMELLACKALYRAWELDKRAMCWVI